MRRIAFIAGAFLLAAFGTQAQQSYESRLESLTPSNPIAYFRLAEEVASSGGTADEQQLARRLYAIAFALTSKDTTAKESEFPIAASACLGLADLERSTSRKRWLLALAGRLDPRYATRSWDASEQANPSNDAALLLAEAIGLSLSGDGSLARERFDDPRVAALLEETRGVLDRPGTGASSTLIKREAQIWPCPECGNARAVPDRSEGGQVRRLCSTCRGNPGPVISRETFVAYLAYQAVILHGTQRSWSADLAVNQGQPLLDPQPEEVAVYVGIDPSKVYYRKGRWLDRSEVVASGLGQE